MSVFGPNANNPQFLPIAIRAAALTGLPYTHLEGVYVTRYGEGGHYNEHVDYGDDFRVDRLYTVLLYLNDMAPSEGGATADPGFSFRAGNAQTTRSCGTAALIPLFSIRLRDTFGGLTYRGHVHPEDLSFINTAASPAYFEVLWNASLTGATWAGLADSTNSGVEFDTAATAVTGGVALSAGYLSAGGVGSNPDTATASGIQPKLVLGRTSANVRDTITVAARGIGGTAALAGNMNFLEQR